MPLKIKLDSCDPVPVEAGTPDVFDDVNCQPDGLPVPVPVTAPKVLADDGNPGQIGVDVTPGDPDTTLADTVVIGDLQITIDPDPPQATVTVARQFPNQPRAVAVLLTTAGIVPAGQIGSETPADLQSRLPFVRVVRIAGGSDLLNDYAQVDLDVFAGTSRAGQGLSEQIREYLSEPAPAYAAGALIDRIECLTAAIELPWADVRIRRYGATYRVVSRRQPALI